MFWIVSFWRLPKQKPKCKSPATNGDYLPVGISWNRMF